MQVFAPSTAIWFLINFQTCYQVLNFSEKLLINRSFIIQKFPMLFSFFVVVHWRVYGKGDLYSRWKYVHACLSVYVWQERSSPTFCNYFSQQIPINPNTQTLKPASMTTSGNFIKNNRTLPVSFRVISTHLIGCWLFFVGVGICWPRTISNFNITLFRPRAGVQPKDTFWVFSPVRFLIHTRTGLSPI